MIFIASMSLRSCISELEVLKFGHNFIVKIRFWKIVFSQQSRTILVYSTLNCTAYLLKVFQGGLFLVSLAADEILKGERLGRNLTKIKYTGIIVLNFFLY